MHLGGEITIMQLKALGQICQKLGLFV